MQPQTVLRAFMLKSSDISIYLICKIYTLISCRSSPRSLKCLACDILLIVYIFFLISSVKQVSVKLPPALEVQMASKD